MRLGLLKILAVAGLSLAAVSCANRTGDQSIAEYCAEPGHADYDLCEQHRDIEGVRTSLGDRIPLQGLPSELAELASTFNAMLDRIESLVRGSAGTGATGRVIAPGTTTSPLAAGGSASVSCAQAAEKQSGAMSAISITRI